MTVNAQTFRDVMARLAMPVTVVTTVDPAGRRHGATVGSVVSLSLDPPLVMFALGRRASLHRPACESPRFAISILTSAQRAVAERFSADAAARFDGDIALFDGLPVVADAAAWLLCERWQLVAAGDHTVVIGRVEHAVRGVGARGEAAAGPLVYHERGYHELRSVAGGGDGAARYQAPYAETLGR